MKTITRTLFGLGMAALAIGVFAHGSHKYSASQARSIALKKYHGTVVGKIPLENEEGKWEYAVTIRSGKTLREVMVGADNGKIENVEVTTAREEAKEAAAEKAGHKVIKEGDEKNEKGEMDEKNEAGEKGEATEKVVKAKTKHRVKAHAKIHH